MNTKEKLLIDFVENELHPSMEGDVELLLKHSNHDRTVVKNLKQVRKLVKKSDEAIREEFVVDKKGDRLIGEDFYMNLHNKIMASIVTEADSKMVKSNQSLKLTQEASVASQPHQKKLWRASNQITLVK